MLLYNDALVILKQVISLYVCAMSTVLIYYDNLLSRSVCVISFYYSVDNLRRTCCSSSCKHNTVRL